MRAIIISLVIITGTCFLFALLGLVADGYRAIRCWIKSDKWTQANENWTRWQRRMIRDGR